MFRDDLMINLHIMFKSSFLVEVFSFYWYNDISMSISKSKEKREII